MRSFTLINPQDFDYVIDGIENTPNNWNNKKLILDCNVIYRKSLLKYWIFTPTCDSVKLTKRQTSVSLFCRPQLRILAKNLSRKETVDNHLSMAIHIFFLFFRNAVLLVYGQPRAS
uniref:PINc domain-containing protein n=1 Tax=Strongyloides papillosus TaxID=174720 RepID=A0A0N5BDJ0_STREA